MLSLFPSLNCATCYACRYRQVGVVYSKVMESCYYSGFLYSERNSANMRAAVSTVLTHGRLR